MSGLRSRRKGKAGEVQVAALLRDLYPEVRTKRAGGESATQDRGRDLLGCPGLCSQVKLSARPNPIQAWREASKAALQTETAVAFVKQSTRQEQTPWLAVLDAQALIGLLAIAQLQTLKAKED